MVQSKSVPGYSRSRSDSARRDVPLTRPGAQSSPSNPIRPTAGTPQADELGRLLIKIERLRRVVTTAFLALKHQNVERDWDIACALQFSVVDPMNSLEEEGWQLVVALGGKALEDERP